MRNSTQSGINNLLIDIHVWKNKYKNINMGTVASDPRLNKEYLINHNGLREEDRRNEWHFPRLRFLSFSMLEAVSGIRDAFKRLFAQIFVYVVI